MKVYTVIGTDKAGNPDLSTLKVFSSANRSKAEMYGENMKQKKVFADYIMETNNVDEETSV